MILTVSDYKRILSALGREGGEAMSDCRVPMPVYDKQEIVPCRHCGCEASPRFDLGARFLYSNVRIGSGWFCGCRTYGCKGYVFKQERWGNKYDAIKQWNKINE